VGSSCSQKHPSKTFEFESGENLNNSPSWGLLRSLTKSKNWISLKSFNGLFSRQVKPDWPLIVQCSSIGSLGPTPESWVETELASSLGRGSRSVHLVYPSKSNVLESLDGILGGCCLPYSRLKIWSFKKNICNRLFNFTTYVSKLKFEED